MNASVLTLGFIVGVCIFELLDSYKDADSKGGEK